jgi:hypothetical protein
MELTLFGGLYENDFGRTVLFVLLAFGVLLRALTGGCNNNNSCGTLLLDWILRRRQQQ